MTCAKHLCVVASFLSVCGFVMTEVLVASLPQLLSVRAYVLAVSVIICWLSLDNLLLAWDLIVVVHEPPAWGAESELHLLRMVSYANQRRSVVLTSLHDEMASHLHTARRLDHLMPQMDEGILTALHWSTLASKFIIYSEIPRLREKRRRLVVTRRRSRSAESIIIRAHASKTTPLPLGPATKPLEPSSGAWMGPLTTVQ